MAPTQSTQRDASDEKIEAARKDKVVKAIMISGFLSVCQHVMVLQSEPMLMKMLYKGDVSRSARALANSQGAVGALALILNQFGGKLTDAIGRKPGLLVGPVGNICLGLLVYSRPTSPALVIVCRILRMIITTFSNTVVASAAFADILKGPELAALGSKIGAVAGIGLIFGPFLEAQLLMRLKHPRYSYLMISMLACAQAATTMLWVSETLPKEKRIPIGDAVTISSLNPFGFTKVYTKGSKSLQKMVNLTSMQFFLEGKNISDYGMQWWVNHLEWSTLHIRNFVMGYGFSCMAGGMFLVPKLVGALSARQFTTFGNAANAANYALKATAGASTLAYIVASVVGLPGVNAASGTVVRALSTEKAVQEGFGKGEFSAWINNLRAIVSAIAPMLYGNIYASMSDTWPAVGFGVGGVLGAAIPQYLLFQISDAELSLSKGT